MTFGNVSSFFNKTKHLEIPNEEVRRLSSEIIQNKIGVSIGIEKIKLVNGVLKIDTNPLVKSEIFIKKNTILTELKKICKEKTPKDIR